MAEMTTVSLQTAPTQIDMLAEKYDDLVEKTAAAQLAEAARKEAELLLFASPAGQAYQNAKREAERAELARREADAICRDVALEYYKLDGGVDHPRIQVRILRKMYIRDRLDNGDSFHLMEWAQGHPDLKLVIPPSVDMKKFEKYARAMEAVAPLEFVDWHDVPVVAIKLPED